MDNEVAFGLVDVEIKKKLEAAEYEESVANTQGVSARLRERRLALATTARNEADALRHVLNIARAHINKE